MPITGSITILASGSASPWYVLDVWEANSVGLSMSIVGTARGKVEYTYADVGTLGTAAANATNTFELTAMASVNTNTAAGFTPPLPTAFRVTCVSASGAGDGITFAWVVQDN